MSCSYVYGSDVDAPVNPIDSDISRALATYTRELKRSADTRAWVQSVGYACLDLAAQGGPLGSTYRAIGEKILDRVPDSPEF
jgi:hypothetical protein